MLKIKVKPFYHLKDIMGKNEVEMELDGKATAREVITELTKMFGEKFKEALIDPKTGSIRSYYRVLLKGRDLHHLEDLDTRLSDGDVISLFPPVAGGSKSKV